ncbi:hypothetical protein [Clostridium culturomicium]|uniref:hypothetical protein n=2 Tax=Clostridium culturomicium TaxID=1499683 RepID=UPI0005901901
MGFYIKLFLILTYFIYLSLMTFSFIKINQRIKHILNKNNLTCVLYNHYNVFSVMEGLKSFLALLFLTLFPILHFTGYFLIFALLTEYTESKLLNIIINKELLDFKKEIKAITESRLFKLFIANNRYKGFNHKIRVICNYFSHENAKNNLFIFFQFLSFKNSLHNFNLIIKENTETDNNLLQDYCEDTIRLEKDINFTFNLIKKYEVHYA